MYQGRERLGTKKNPGKPIYDLQYTEDNLAYIEEIVAQIKKDYPEFNDIQARIWEVVSRLRGDNGLSASRVSYLASAICEVLKDTDESSV